MGLFDFFKKKTDTTSSAKAIDSYSAVPDETESKYYQPKEYYTTKAFEGTQFERSVITFEARKETCIPSKNGLYVAEILLLAMCSSYPNPQNGYPGYWWFQYGIRNVGNALKSLEQRKFIQLLSATDSLSNMTVAQPKELLEHFNLSTAGKKSDLIDRLKSNLRETDLADVVSDRKYTLTELGEQELQENEYVLYMHRHPQKTTEGSTFGPQFNVWAVNKRLGGNTINWRVIVDAMEHDVVNFHNARNQQNRQKRQEVDPKKATKLNAQDTQLKQIQLAEEQYAESGNIDALIAFWEEIWKSGGLLFNGSKWTFRLPDLYIKQKRYDDALRILKKIKKPQYQEKVQGYIEKIEKARNRPGTPTPKR